MNNTPGKIIAIIFVLLAVVLLTIGCSESTSNQGSGGVKSAPDFTLYSLDGQTISLSDFRGQPVFLNFWASWCGPCRAEMPLIQTVYERQISQSPSVIMLSVNLGEGPVTIENFMQENELTFPVLMDIEQAAGQDYNIRSIPTTFFIDNEGIIQDVKIGSFSSVAEIERSLDKLLK